MLHHEQYMEGKVWWCSEEAWPHLCTWWCCDDYKAKREKARRARLSPTDVAQNHGGSCKFTETKQLLKHKYGPEKASDLKTYQVMKSGMKNIDLATGDSGPISSQKVHKRLNDYATSASAEHPDDWDQRPFDPAILYDINGGLLHGRLPLGVGALSKTSAKSAARSNNMKPSNSSSYRAVLRENQELR
ncbi:uncharacterized protein LOC124697518 [Lolium rigidum]|uniref:uncharacterized protein LOC124697518 n=1 Tax=Lolium rigidum TaxID=89674 RepID=UPI001F5D4DEA|nr:uncharacterized protein LOC124697518 [Lolium rigidum]